MLRNDVWVVKLLCFKKWNGVLLYSPIVCYGVWETLLAQLLLPGPRKEAVESGTVSNVKNVDFLSSGILEQVLQTALDVDVRGLCIGSIGGVVRFSKLSQLQCAAAVFAGSYGVFHFCCLSGFCFCIVYQEYGTVRYYGWGTALFSLVYSAKLGIMV